MDLKFLTQHLILILNLFIVINARSLPENRFNYCTYEQNNKFYDLRSLSLKSTFQTVRNGNDTYFINICSKENRFTNNNDDANLTLCKKYTSICLVNEEHQSGLDIGNFRFNTNYEFQMNEQGNLVMNFNQTDLVLPNLNCSTLKSTITFLCQKTRALENAPILKSKTDCSFNFEWKTSEACADKHSFLEPRFKNDSLIFLINDEEINLNSIIKPQSVAAYYENGDSYEFVIKMKDLPIGNKFKNSSNFTECEGSFVCQIKNNSNDKLVRPVAKLNNSTLLKYANDSFHLILLSDSKCGRLENSSTSAIFNLYCDDDNLTTFRAENNACHYIFDVFNPEICKFKTPFNNTLGNETGIPTSSIKPIDTMTTILLKEIKTTEIPKVKTATNPSRTKTEPIVTPKTSDSTLNQKKSKVLVSDPVKTSIFGSQATSISETNQGDSNSNTTLFGFIILVIVSVVGIVLAVFSLINDDRRAWLQNRVRRVITPETSSSFHYRQLSTNILLMNNNDHENFNSPYSPTVIPKSPKTDQSKYEVLTNDQPTYSELTNNQQFSLRNDSLNLKSSIREQYDKLRLVNDNDLGVSKDNFNSISFRTKNNLNLKDESELNFLT